jgi:hypothetical protein
MYQNKVRDEQYQSPEFLKLFEVYTANAQSIGANLTALTTAAAGPDTPLIIATGADFVLYPGGGRPPEVEGYRLSTRGFKELAAVSHFGSALASIVRIRELDHSGEMWRVECKRLLVATEAARQANSPEMWRDLIAVPAYVGREVAIANMIDYACDITERYIHRALEKPETFTAEDLRIHYLEATGNAVGASVPLNKMMIATFFLVGMDTGHRVITWFDQHVIDWSKAMVLIVGRQGRPTAGVTWATNAVCSYMLGASRNVLSLERIYIAPHVAFNVARPINIEEIKAQEGPMRKLWWGTRAMSDLAPMMYAAYPRFSSGSSQRPVLQENTTEVTDMPAIQGPDDWRSLNTRLRVILEDPRQLLAGCVVDYAVDMLQQNGNDPTKVIVPGLDGTTYPSIYG